ncbi:MAG: prenyltransferase [Ignavibacteria bacterium]|nr:prenyltransferase [Ignavibacteria bacterium]
MSQLSAVQRLKALIELVRFELPFAAGVCTVLGQLLALGGSPSMLEIVGGFAAIFLISASALILNDLFDVESDKVNAPHRPLPSQRVTGVEVVSFFVIVTIVGLFISALLGVEALVLSFTLWTVALLYNWRFKRTGLLGNLMVSFSVGMTFVFGGVSVGIYSHELVWYFAILAALINLGEEIAADAMDVVGDSKAQFNSIAVKFGRARALDVSTAIFSAVLVLSIAPFPLKWLPGVYLYPILLMDSIILYSVIRLRASKEQEGRKLIRAIYLGATFSMLVILLLRIFET